MGGRKVVREPMCFACGAEQRGVKSDTGIDECLSCGRLAVLTYQTALDILNGLHISGSWCPPEEEQETDELMEELNFNEN